MLFKNWRKKYIPQWRTIVGRPHWKGIYPKEQQKSCNLSRWSRDDRSHQHHLRCSFTHAGPWIGVFHGRLRICLFRWPLHMWLRLMKCNTVSRFPETVKCVLCKCTNVGGEYGAGVTVSGSHTPALYFYPRTGLDHSQAGKKWPALLSNLISFATKYIRKLKLTTFIFSISFHTLWGWNWKLKFARPPGGWPLPLRPASTVEPIPARLIVPPIQSFCMSKRIPPRFT